MYVLKKEKSILKVKVGIILSFYYQQLSVAAGAYNCILFLPEIDQTCMVSE